MADKYEPAATPSRGTGPSSEHANFVGRVPSRGAFKRPVADRAYKHYYLQCPPIQAPAGARWPGIQTDPG